MEFKIAWRSLTFFLFVQNKNLAKLKARIAKQIHHTQILTRVYLALVANLGR